VFEAALAALEHHKSTFELSAIDIALDVAFDELRQSTRLLGLLKEGRPVLLNDLVQSGTGRFTAPEVFRRQLCQAQRSVS